MLGLLLNVNFSQEKLSLYSLMFVLDTIGTSSPEIVPAVGIKGSFSAQCHLAFKQLTHRERELLWLQHVIMNALMDLFSHF